MYKHFRHKKYGDPLPIKHTDKTYYDEVDDLFEDDKEYIAKIQTFMKKDAFADVRKLFEAPKE